MLCATRDFWKYVTMLESLSGLQLTLGACDASQRDGDGMVKLSSSMRTILMDVAAVRSSFCC